LEKRKFPPKKIAENIAAEILDVCLYDAIQAYGERKICEVDVSRRNAEEVTEELIDVVEGRRKARIGIVDWLTQLEIAGRLDEFLDTL
jgi:broad-specificity NMP kinase